MPFNYDALDELIQEISPEGKPNQRVLYRELVELRETNPDFNSRGFGPEIIWKWVHRKVSPNVQSIDAIHHVAHKYGLDLQFYTPPNSIEKKVVD